MTMRAAVAEFIGTFILVVVGTGVVIAAALHENTAGAAYNSFAIALAFGLSLIAIVASIGSISGGHVNPAVTLGLAVAGKFPWRQLPIYWIAQLLGGICASLTIWLVYGQSAMAKVQLGTTAPAHGSSDLQVFCSEGLVGFILVLTVAATTSDSKIGSGSAAIAIGFALAAGVLLGGPVSGGAGNPARALAPMIVSSTYHLWYLYVLGPLAFGSLAGLIFRYLGTGGAIANVAADER